MANPSRYRFIEFYGGRILEAREAIALQRIQEGLNTGGTARVAFDLDALYREGATFNVLPTISSGSVILSAINSALPMYIFVRGRWEILQSNEVASPLTIASGGGNVYLNWVLRQVTSSEDATLVDTNTGQPTADMGELDLSVSNSDTSGVALASNQFEKNTSPIILFTYNSSSNLLPIDNVNPVAWGNLNTSGLVSLTTNTSSGKACASDDSRLSDSRSPLSGTVEDASVRVPLAVTPNANNSDGTPVYNLSSDPGGISSAKIVHLPGTQLVSDVIQWIKGQLSSIFGTLTSHIGVQLGSSATHPFPTAAQVGAAPLSHVGQPLGLATSHPASVTANSGGFSLNRDATVAPLTDDPAYGLFSTGTLKSALYHDGDIFSSTGTSVVATPISPATTSGPLNLFSTVAQVLGQHVNQTSHANPHGLSFTDLISNQQLLAPNGYVIFPGSIIIQWGQAPSVSDATLTTVTFPIEFPNMAFVPILGQVWPAGQNSSLGGVRSLSNTGFTFELANAGVVNGGGALYWFAIGY